MDDQAIESRAEERSRCVAILQGVLYDWQSTIPVNVRSDILREFRRRIIPKREPVRG